MKLFCWIAFFSFTLFSGQNYTTKWYGMDNGLPQNSVKDIIKDKYGFIWLSTEGGIVRWDGDNFTLYNNFKLKNLSFAFFCGNSKNDSIFIYNDFFRERLIITQRNVKQIAVDPAERPSFFRDNVSYYQYVKTTLVSKADPYFKYYIKFPKCLYYFNKENVRYEDEISGQSTEINLKFPNIRFNKFFAHKDRIFIADPGEKKILQLHKGKLSSITGPAIYTDPHSKIYWQQSTDQVLIINNGNVFLSTFDGRELKAKFILQYKDIDKETSHSMFYDEKENKLYIGSLINGLKILSLSNFYISKKNVPYENEVYYAALPFGKSSVLTQQGFVFSKDKAVKEFSTRLYTEERYLIYDNNGNLICRDNNSIQKRYKASHFTKYDSVTFHRKYIEGIFKSGGLYMAAVSKDELKTLYIYENDQFKNIVHTFNFNNDIKSVLRYNDDLLYVGGSGGLYVLSLSKNKVVKNIAKDLPIKEIIRTKDGNVWLTTYGRGFYFLKKDEVVKLPADKNNYIETAHTLQEDHRSNFWISTNNGLFKVSKHSLLQYVQDKKTIVPYYRYTKTDGFSNNEFNGNANPASNVLADGQFVFPSMEGFVFFKPEEIKTYFPKPDDIFIERMRINDGIITYFNGKLNLKKDYNKAEIFIDMPYYANIENIYLQAKLEGSGNWINIKNDRKFLINNVKPGEYNLMVRFLTRKNGSFVYKTIPVEIEAYFYQTTAFRILVLLLLIMIVLLIVWIRTNILQKNLNIKDKELQETATTLQLTKEKLKDEAQYQKELVSSITHDITTPVRFITMLSKKLMEAKDAETQKMYFDSIYNSAEKLHKFTFGLKKYTELFKQQNVPDEDYYLNDIIEEKRMLFDEIALQNNTSIINECDPDVKVRINPNILLAIFHNLIDNAVKNTSDGEIIISAVSKNSMVEVQVADTGTGMSKEKMEYYNNAFKSTDTEKLSFKSNGLGLHMVNQLVRKIDSEIFFKQNLKGTTVVLNIKSV
jgi:signal transduction histidine kinase